MAGGVGNTRDWLARARAAGAVVRLNGRSETHVEKRPHKPVVVTTRRKDAPRALVMLVRKLEREIA